MANENVAGPVSGPVNPPAVFPVTANPKQQYAVRSKLARRVVHVTNPGLDTLDAQADARVELQRIMDTSPEQEWEVVEAFSS